MSYLLWHWTNGQAARSFSLDIRRIIHDKLCFMKDLLKRVNKHVFDFIKELHFYNQL